MKFRNAHACAKHHKSFRDYELLCRLDTSSCFEFWWFELMVINVVFKFGPVELIVGL